MSPRLSAIVIAKNEARNIEACLDSLAFCDQRIVVDGGSDDGTASLAEGKGASVTVAKEWRGFGHQKNFALSLATGDWVLSVDADERVTPELAAEIKSTLNGSPAQSGFRVPRVTWHLGKWIRTTDWYPDYQLRLYDRRRARWQSRRVHESVAAEGDVGRLANDLQHYAYRDLSHHYQTMDRYTTLAAEEMHANGRRTGFFHLTIHPWAAFMRNYVLRRGFLDGRAGFIISVMNAYYVFLKFAKLWALQRR
jgi:glycosyltransferase involved in cell wall biosynthesis